MLNYSSAWGNLTDLNGSITQAVINTYTIPLGSWIWFLAIFSTVMIVYIKTQSTGMAVFVGLLFFALAQSFVGLVGNSIFVIILILGLTFLLFRLWKG